MTAQDQQTKKPIHGDESTGAPFGSDPKNPRRDAKTARMGTAPVGKLILEFAIPTIFGMLVNGAYNVIDSIFLGQAMGETGLSVATAAMPVMTIFMAVAMLIGNGGNALAALRLGEGSRKGAEVSLGNTVSLSIIVAVIVAVLALIPACMGPLLTVSGATPDIFDMTYSFMSIICFGFIFQCIAMGVNNFIRTAGSPGRALGTMVVGLVAATVFNYLFVLVLGWGVVGSALATVLGQVVSCVTVLWYFIFTKNVPIKLHLHCMKIEIPVIRHIFSLGLASFVVQAGMAVVNFAVNHLLVTYGAQSPYGSEGALAAIGIVQRCAMFTVLPLIGIAVAIQPLLGFNYAAGLIDRVRKTLWGGVIGATLVGVVMWGAIHLWPAEIVSVFGIRDGALQSFTIVALQIQLLMLPLVGFQIVGSNYFQATGQPGKSIFLSLTRQILFLLPIYLFLPDLLPQIASGLIGLDAVYMAPPISDALAIFTVGILLFFEMKRLKKIESGELEATYVGKQERS